MRRCHIGCGSVYLRPSIADDPDNGWINIDLSADGRFTTSERRGLVDRLGTTDEDYYGKSPRSSITDFATPIISESVIDQVGSFADTHLPSQSVGEILSRQVFEHLSPREAEEALIECDRILVPGGILRLDVPDHDATVKALMETRDPFYPRHLFGSRKDRYGFHVMNYRREDLTALAESFGFQFIAEEPNIHLYPAFCLRFKKIAANNAPWEYAGVPDIPDDWFCIDVGSGPFPWPRANVLVDLDDNAKVLPGRKMFHCSADALPFMDKSVDWLFCSHLLEHVPDPVAVAREFSRVAKRGMIVTPGKFKEVLFAFDEPTHRWWIEKRGDRLVFEPADKIITDNVRDVEFSKVMHRLLRLGPATFHRDSLTARRWFWRNERHLDIIHQWEGELKIEVLR